MNATSRIERTAGDIGLRGLVDLLQRRLPNSGGAGAILCVDGLDSPDLVLVATQADNIRLAAFNGLRVVAELASGFDESVDSFPHVSVGWLVKELTEQAEIAFDFAYCSRTVLIGRGYNEKGEPLAHAAVVSP